MVNDDDFPPDGESDPGRESLDDEVKRLRALSDELQERLWEKDRLLEQYWDTIQDMRMINRLKRVITPWRSQNIATRNRNWANPGISTLNNKDNKKSICIKIAVYNWKVAHTWGDFYFAISLRKALVRMGYKVLIQTRDEWYDGGDKDADVILVIRGLTRYFPRKGKTLHLLWNISHPADVTDEEYSSYAHVFIASESWAYEVRRRLGNSVSCLLQCTDFSVFKRAIFPIRSEILFVGNARGVLRSAVAGLLQSPYGLSIYGNGWENMIPTQYIRGSFIEHSRLYRYYAGANILLNDHWEDMREYGFISNRVFDALACRAFIISDHVEGLESIFSGGIVTYKSSNDLRDLVSYYLNNHDQRHRIALTGHRSMSKAQSFDARAGQISRIIETAFE